MDISEAVGAAYNNLKRFENVHVIQGDIYNPPLKPLFHMVYCIGVIQHLPEPGRGFSSLAELMKPGGRFFVWVYGKRVGVYRTIDLLRKITTRLPMRVLYPLTFILNIVSHIFFSWPFKILRSTPGCKKLAGLWPFGGYPFNRSYHMFSAWRILALASTTRARLASFKPGFEPMRTAWTTSNGCGGPTASSVRVAATKAVGAWAMAASCVRRVRHAVR